MCLPGIYTWFINKLNFLILQVEESELADVAAVSAGNNYEMGNMIAEAMSKVGRKGVVTLVTAVHSLCVVEGIQFDRCDIYPYFATAVKRCQSNMRTARSVA